MNLTDEQKFLLIQEIIRTQQVDMTELPKLFSIISNLGTDITKQEPPIEPGVVKPLTGKQWRKFVKDDAIISCIDGKSYKILKRHIAQHGLTVKQYLEKYGLPKDFPLVAPSYASARSELAKTMGLGKRLQSKPRKKAVND